MTAQVSYLKNALTPQHRDVMDVESRSIQSLAPDWQIPYVAFLDGEPVLRADWELVVEDGHSLAFVDVNAIPQGGGNGGSNPLTAILMIAVAIYAPYLAGSLYGAMGGTLVAANAGMMISAMTIGIQMVGMALISALMPPPQPTSPQTANALAAASTTYNLQAQGNTARLEAAIPEHFGRMLAYPDFAAQPYQEFAGNEQYIYQLLCIGRGSYDIESVRIEDTPIANFDDIVYEVVPPGGTLALFPSSVLTSVEVSGQTLTTGTYIGSFVANAAGSTANYLGFDFLAPRGLYYANDNGDLSAMSVTVSVEARQINSLGTPVGAWVVLTAGTVYGPWSDWAYVATAGTNSATEEFRTDSYPGSEWDPNPSSLSYRRTRTVAYGSEEFSGATTTPQRYSRRYAVAAGRYEVRVKRTDTEQTSTRYGHNFVWGGLRSYLQDNRTFGDVTLIGLRMRASNSLSMQSSRKINVIAYRKLPIWNGSTWSAPTATRSIAWPIVYAAKQIGLTDAQIDLAALLALNTTWSARGDRFDARFDNFLSFWEAVTKIAGAGRAKPYMQGGILRIFRDQAATVPVALYSMRNIVRGSFSVDYLMPTVDTADQVNVGYFDETNWAPARVSAKLPGSASLKPVKVDLFGVTGRDQAFREGMKLAADNRYRRKLIKFDTEMEGFIPSFGDLIAIQHDMPAWGQGGEVTAWNAGTKTATLSEPPVWGTGTHYIGLRKRDGSVDGPFVVTAGAQANQVVLATSPSFTPYTGQSEERTHFAFGWAETWRQRARVLSAKPQGPYRVSLECVNEDDNVHNAEAGAVTPVAPVSQLAGYQNAPVLKNVTAYPMRDNPGIMVLSWPAAAWAQSYVVEQSSDGLVWAPSGSTGTTTCTTPIFYGKTSRFRAAAIGLSRGPWFNVQPDVTPPPSFDVFTVMVQPDGTRQYNFSYNAIAAQPVDWKGAEIRYVSGTFAAPDWATMTRLQDQTTYYTNSPVELNAPLSGTYTFACKSLDTTGNESAYLVRTITLPDRRLGNVFDEFYEHSAGWLGTLTGCHVQDGVLEANDATTWATLPATWDGWTRWNFAPTSPISYTSPVRDFGTVIAGQINSTVDADGTVVQELATSADGTTWSAWSSAAAPFSTRYLKLRLTVTASGPAPVPVIRAWGYQINAPMRSEYINDLVISSLTGSYRIGVGDIRIPLAGVYSVLKRTTPVIQDSSAGTWSYARIDQVLTYGPRWQFRLNGVLADPAFVDFIIEGY